MILSCIIVWVITYSVVQVVCSYWTETIRKPACCLPVSDPPRAALRATPCHKRNAPSLNSAPPAGWSWVNFLSQSLPTQANMAILPSFLPFSEPELSYEKHSFLIMWHVCDLNRDQAPNQEVKRLLGGDYDELPVNATEFRFSNSHRCSCHQFVPWRVSFLSEQLQVAVTQLALEKGKTPDLFPLFSSCFTNVATVM